MLTLIQTANISAEQNLFSAVGYKIHHTYMWREQAITE